MATMPTEPVVAATFNKELIEREGEAEPFAVTVTPEEIVTHTVFYEMREDGIVIGSGKSSIYFPWERILEIRDQGEYLEIAGKIRKLARFCRHLAEPKAFVWKQLTCEN